MRFFQQFWLMTQKNFIVMRKSPVWTFFELLLPVAFAALVSHLVYKDHEFDVESHLNETISPSNVSLIREKFKPFGSPPFYSVNPGINVTEVNELMEKLCDQRCPLYIDTKEKLMKELEYQSAIGLLFTELDRINKRLTYEYHVPEFKGFGTYMTIPLQHSLNSAFLKSLNLSALPDVQVQEFALNKDQMLIWLAIFPIYHYFYFILLLPTLMHTGREIAVEKERGIKDFLDVMGLKTFNFIASHIFLGWLKGSLIITIASIWPAFRITGFFGSKFDINFLIFVIPLYFYVLAGMIFAALIASIFKNSNSTIKAIAILHPLLVFLTFWSHSNAPITSPIQAAIASLNYNTAFANVLVVIGNYMKRNRSLSYCQLFEQNDLMLNIGPLMALLLLDIFLMGFCLYFVEVYQKTSTLPIKSTLKRIFHSKNKDEIDYERNFREEVTHLPKAHEELPKAVENDVVVEKLSKRWNSSSDYAVYDMNLQACRGELTVLLGHNGAGKSTTFSMICGITQPTSGTVHINSETIGFCPQGNALFEKLTVAQHLWFFHQIKGGTTNWRDEMNELLGALGMSDKENENVMALSGGMQRKLCLAMALIGGSRVVLLDEPTAGIDVGARMDVQRMLSAQKKDRTILLTTHYMDEAETLGDRIAIMVKGRCVTSGSPRFLKERFDTGYILTCVLNDDVANDPEATKAFLEKFQEYELEAKIHENKAIHGRQVEIILPMEIHERFERIFGWLEGQPEVSTFGLSINNLEHVFLKVGEMTDKSNNAVRMEEDNEEMINAKVENCFLNFLFQLLALLKKRWYFSLHNWHQAIFQLVLPALIIAFCIFFTTGKKEESSADIGPMHTIDFTSVDLAKFFIAGSTVAPYFSLIDSAKKAKNLRIKKISGTSYVTDLVHQSTDLPTAFFGVKLSNASAPLFFYGSQEEVLSQNWALMAMFNALANAHLNDGGSGSISMKFSNVKTVVAPLEGEDNYLMNSIVMGLLSVIVFSMLTSPFSIFYVVEQVSKFWHQQRLTGVSTSLIHFASILFDYLIFLLMSFLICLGFFISGWSSEQLHVIWLILAYFLATMANIYLLSSFFSSPSKANVLIMIYQTLGAYGSLFIVTTLYTFAKDISDRFSIPLQILFPSFGLCWGIWSCRIMSNPESFSADASAASTALENYHKTILILIVSGIVQFLVVFAYRSSLLRYYWMRLCCKYPKHYEPVTTDEDEEDVDVREERKLLNQGNLSLKPKLILELNELTKKYGTNVAVNSLTFGVREGECFGLLGVNGAGKTTTFGLITGEIFANGGHVRLNGEEIKEIKKMGYCPQFDAFMTDLTGREVLSLLSALYGYKYPDRKANSILKAVLMEKHGDKQLKNCSGGQKRKISVGIALLADSSLVILDEPTAGIDPKAQREIWSLIGKFKKNKNSAVLLCSHSMNECEALCNKVGILVGGKLKALGTTQQLKTKYGNSYELTLVYPTGEETQTDCGQSMRVSGMSGMRSGSTQRLVPPRMAELLASEENIELQMKRVDERMVQERTTYHFPGAKIYREGIHTNVYRFTVPRDDRDQWSTLWRKSERIAKETNAVNFSIAQNTLLQTFLRGGQKRKISVGIALLADSSLVILDEPTAGIDPKAQREIWSLIGNDHPPIYREKHVDHEFPILYLDQPSTIAPYPQVHRGTISSNETFSPHQNHRSERRNTYDTYDRMMAHPPCALSLGNPHDNRPWLVRNRKKLQVTVCIVLLFLVIVPLVGFLIHLAFRN
ncbi:unnamed protein product, partial [Mesorhabditis belari]|uniref:ABC transporter domain-containing protein n=1 Tax=Mesorhabditis belari TaxID=2138241 RepID=A0AAF3EBK5_9BILA